MAKLTIMHGLPASGKSTRAKEIIHDRGGTIRINKDLLRTMLHFGVYNRVNEQATQEAASVLAEYFLKNGKNVIIDDTNLNPKTVERWKGLGRAIGASLEHVTMETPLSTCLERDRAREASVGSHVIHGMAMQYQLATSQKPVVICDIDGTIANIDHRLHHVQKTPKDWKSFFQEIHRDTPRNEVIDMLLEEEEKGNEIFLVSGRSDEYRKETEEWLEQAFKGYTKLWTTVFMRQKHDKRPDTQVKEEIYDRYFSKRNVVLVIDDRPSVIRMWKSKGLSVRDVGKGVEF